jgi:hypothetical protein
MAQLSPINIFDSINPNKKNVELSWDVPFVQQPAPFSNAHHVPGDYVKTLELKEADQLATKTLSKVSEFRFLDRQPTGIKTCLEKAFKDDSYDKFLLITDATSKLKSRHQLYSILKKDTDNGKAVLEATIHKGFEPKVNDIIKEKEPTEWRWTIETLRKNTKYAVTDKRGEKYEPKGIVIALDSAVSPLELAQDVELYIDPISDALNKPRDFIIVKKALQPINEFINI